MENHAHFAFFQSGHYQHVGLEVEFPRTQPSSSSWNRPYPDHQLLCLLCPFPKRGHTQCSSVPSFFSVILCISLFSWAGLELMT